MHAKKQFADDSELSVHITQSLLYGGLNCQDMAQASSMIRWMSWLAARWNAYNGNDPDLSIITELDMRQWVLEEGMELLLQTSTKMREQQRQGLVCTLTRVRSLLSLSLVLAVLPLRFSTYFISKEMLGTRRVRLSGV